MTLGLGQHTVTRIHQDDCEISSTGTGRHIPGVLFMPGCISNDELSLGR